MASDAAELLMEGVDKLVDKHFDKTWDKGSELKQKAAKQLPKMSGKKGGDAGGEESGRRSGGSGHRRDRKSPSRDNPDTRRRPSPPPPPPPADDEFGRRATTGGEPSSKRSSRRPREEEMPGERALGSPDDHRAKRVQSTPVDGPGRAPASPGRHKRSERDRDRDRHRDSRHGGGSGSGRYGSPRTSNRRDHRSSGSKHADYEEMGRVRSSRTAPKYPQDGFAR